jgi:hypothetical protein
MFPPFLLAALLLGGTATAIPASSSEGGGSSECTPRTLCVDGINTCGVRFGGCYDVCKPESKPIAPLCVSAIPAPLSSTASVVATPTTTTIKSTRTRHRPSSRTRRPRPTREPSGTPITVTSVPVSVPVVTTPPLTSVTCPDGRLGSGQTLCVDNFDKCGQSYGGYVHVGLSPVRDGRLTWVFVDVSRIASRGRRLRYVSDFLLILLPQRYY